MKNIHTKAIAVIFGLLSFGAQAVSSLTFQGVTFASQAIDADTLEFSILNSNHATGDWSGASFLKAFEIKGLGTEVLSGKLISGPGVTALSFGSVTAGVAANLGCTTGGTRGTCFSFATPLALTSNMTWRIDFTAAAPLVFDTPHIKVQFLGSLGDKKKMGELLSKDLVVSAVPEPETYALLLAGLGLVGAAMRKRKA
ncbi:PEPxxWA-CTERM sorting domain-containing protein [Rhodoferax sp. TBRC 17198]|uniref:PEPxxWA-CTERM sorting domain-containing protein n=1 Tax=Rhodoferax potami TaxID=3068338 RepID=UPI0028BDB415|nr:PEPxxWA-CTERM sorting domain-containing protein [Rhodoferax sp. TBRC 17198]MDT7523104.1 PEPxxWA-CTERM sorting domain-containing protein [Rhodoferax sp. TBRC 17198]